MWIFIFTEILLFGGLFLVYAVMRNRYADEFHQAAHQLNAFIGTVNTVVLLLSSATVAMSITAVQKGDKRKGYYLFLLHCFAPVSFFSINTLNGDINFQSAFIPVPT